MSRYLLLAVLLSLGCGSEDSLNDTRPVDSGYTVVEVSVTDTGTAPVTDSTTPGDGSTDSAVVDTGTPGTDTASSKTLVLTPAGDSTARGGSAGTTFADDCPTGQVPTGIEVSMGTGANDGIVANYRTFCSKTTVTTDKVLLSAGDTVPSTGVRGAATAVGAPVRSSCPANEVIVGFEGREGTAIHALGLVCAPLNVSGASVNVGSSGKVAPVGSTTAGSSFATTLCPAFHVARGVSLRAADVIHSFALRCASPSLS